MLNKLFNEKSYSIKQFYLVKIMILFYLYWHSISILRSDNFFDIDTVSIYITYINLLLFPGILFEKTRAVFSALIFVLSLIFIRRNLLIFGVNDDSINWLLLLLAVIPKLDKSRNTIPQLLYWGTVIVLALAYFSSGLNKLFQSDLWIRGDALSGFVDTLPMINFTFLNELKESLLFKVLTWVVLFFEIMFLPSIFSRTSRKIIFWGLILFLLTLIFFSVVKEIAFVFMIYHLFIFDKDTFGFRNV